MAPWHRTADGMPPMRVQVRVRWQIGDELLELDRVARLPTTTKVGNYLVDGLAGYRRVNAWAAIGDNRKPVILPPSGAPKAWAGEPEYWQPMRPDLWKMPLPPPVPERQVKPARVHVLRAEDYTPVEREWWRDIRPKHSPPGEITPKEAEGRAMRVLMCERAMPDDHDMLGSLTPMSDALYRLGRVLEMAAGKRPTYWHGRFQPTAADLDDVARFAPWLAKIAEHPQDYHVLELRALDPPFTFDKIGERFDVSGERARQLYRDAILALTLIANRGAHETSRSHEWGIA